MDQELLEKAKKILSDNQRGDFTFPANDLYPHQWLWDSCFIAIGLARYDIDRAQREIESLIRGQWSNGMIPNIIFSNDRKHKREHNLWQSWLNPHAPNGLITSGITQPPLMAEAVLCIGKQMKPTERRSWYKKMYPHIARYHAWLYKERDVYDEGLITLIHPYESGLDNSPPWSVEVRQHAWPWWLQIISSLHIENLIDFVRKDIKFAPNSERSDNLDDIAYWNILRKLRAKTYDSKDILKNPSLAIEDLAFNCIFIRANKNLREIAKFIGEPIPSEILEKMDKTAQALELLWDETLQEYFSCSLKSRDLIRESSIMGLMPLYGSSITQDRAIQIVNLLKKQSKFKLAYPVPSVPKDSKFFNELKYWQGPTWVNTNWLIIKGLEEYGFEEEATKLKYQTIAMVKKSGFAEYFSPLNGAPAGAENFSWTAALIIDLLNK